jgi:CHAT domain-containing protein
MPTAGLAGVSGFATSFMKLNASGVIAPLWAVQDKAAFDVAKRFYKAILEGVPFASALQEIRKEAYRGEAPRDAYAAYCFYGDPLAVASTG